jgi:hypothetical protein
MPALPRALAALIVSLSAMLWAAGCEQSQGQ